MEPKGLLVCQYGPVNDCYYEINKLSTWPPNIFKFLPMKLFFLGFPTNSLHAFLITPMQATCSAYLFLRDLFT
jgi:hypothetical protein